MAETPPSNGACFSTANRATFGTVWMENLKQISKRVAVTGPVMSCNIRELSAGAWGVPEIESAEAPVLAPLAPLEKPIENNRMRPAACAWRGCPTWHALGWHLRHSPATLPGVT
jgi:hypothetical protein